MGNAPKFRPLYPDGERRPNPKVLFKPKDPEAAQKRLDALSHIGSFVARPSRAPSKCPLCGTSAEDYRSEYPGEELLLQGGNPFMCAVCGNTEWNI